MAGIAHAAATVLVNEQTTYRRSEFFQAALSYDNSAAALYPSITNRAWYGGVTNTETGSRFIPKTPETFLFDLDGNLVSDGRWTNRWDAENRLIEMDSHASGPSGSLKKLRFTYDDRGRRLTKIVSNWTGSAWSKVTDLRFVYDVSPVPPGADGGMGKLLAEFDADGGLVRSYTWGTDLSGSMHGAGGVGGLIALTVHSGANAGTYFYAYDGNGNVMALVNAATGELAAEYAYGPFGELIRATGPLANENPFRFSTKYHDDETDWIYYGYRYYSPSLGRWPNRDPLGEAGSFNLYGFVHNDPIDYLDPLGLKIEIQGPRDFQKRFKDCIKALRKSKRGKKLYDDAKKSKDVLIIIQPAPDKGGPYAGSPPRAGIGLDPNDPIFVGPEAPIRQYPEELPPYDPNDKKSVARACACALGHELGHAFLDLDDPPDGRNVQDVENPIRIELGLPPRRSYHGIPIAP